MSQNYLLVKGIRHLKVSDSFKAFPFCLLQHSHYIIKNCIVQRHIFLKDKMHSLERYPGMYFQIVLALDTTQQHCVVTPLSKSCSCVKFYAFKAKQSFLHRQNSLEIHCQHLHGNSNTALQVAVQVGAMCSQ